MVGRGGLEPPTSRLSGVRSNHLSYRPIHRPDTPVSTNGVTAGLALELKGYEDGPTVECDILIWMSAKSPHEDCKQSCQKLP